MKIVAISDTHGRDFGPLIPECDTLLIGGDISPTTFHDLEFQKQWLFDTFIPYLKDIPAKNIVFIAGNHDFYLYKLYTEYNEISLRDKLPENIFYLRDSFVKIDNVKIYGTPWVINLKNWAFNLKSKTDERYTYDLVTNDVDILLSHAPAYNFCDTILEYNEVIPLGSRLLFESIKAKRPRLVLNGHIHSASHEPKNILGTEFRCISLLDEKYQIHYKPYVFDYPLTNNL